MRIANQFSWFAAFLASVHIALCLMEIVHPAEGGWAWFFLFLVDLPCAPIVSLLTRIYVPVSISFLVLGTAWWYLVGWLPKARIQGRVDRWISLLAAVTIGITAIPGATVAFENVNSPLDPSTILIGTLPAGALGSALWLLLLIPEKSAGANPQTSASN